MVRKKTKSAARPPKKTSFLEKSQLGISLSQLALSNLNEIVEGTGLTKSKIIEDLVTGNLAIASQRAEKTISIESTEVDENSPDNSEIKIQILDGITASTNQQEAVKSSEQVNTAEESSILAEFKAKIQEHKAEYQALKKRSQEQEALITKL
ncbi:MAG: hypothetical protein ACRC8K_20300, partial [Waterburya sp.]